ncbi:HrpE/YscL family type III secretion apparatus protein [Phyllobacterium salinisoli]|uniref:Type 3 secretion system stator protein n=1 Tax=Phyllobacterium salinisoli TaxID=1899321 RepID=A0A368JZZ8_9HYPH|nr:type III secretion system stator protein SctL [Phyllobacterium salinisoli]RCS22718.1 HrpE/YscL family type III secretion apparatus protein [Phyllobacterium salinisoli]
MNALPPKPPVKIIRHEEADYWRDGYALLQAAQQEAERQRVAAREAYEESRRQGLEAGRQEGEHEAAALLAEVTAKANRYLAGLDQQVVDLSLAVVEKLLGRYRDAELVSMLAQQALSAFRREQQVTVSVAPHIADEVEKLIGESRPELAQTGFAVMADPRLTGDQCVIASPVAVMNAGLDSQLSAIRAALTAAHGEIPDGA